MKKPGQEPSKVNIENQIQITPLPSSHDRTALISVNDCKDDESTQMG